VGQRIGGGGDVTGGEGGRVGWLASDRRWRRGGPWD
jgi:hypothetical protein